jgi:hypothetical protein
LQGFPALLCLNLPRGGVRGILATNLAVLPGEGSVLGQAGAAAQFRACGDAGCPLGLAQVKASAVPKTSSKTLLSSTVTPLEFPAVALRRRLLV